MENAKQAYDAFNRLWGKVPRHVRVDRENHHLMLEVRAFFDVFIETAKRTAMVDLALAAANASSNAASGTVTGDVEQANPIRLALRLLRTLERREWEMVKAVVDLHKFEVDDFLDILDAIQDTHCPRCGEWLDDDDEHENCPVPAEDVPDEEQKADVAVEPQTQAPMQPVQNEGVQNPALQLSLNAALQAAAEPKDGT